MNKDVSVFPYVVRFAVVYTLALACLSAAMAALNVHGNSGTSIVALIAAVAFTAARFVKDQRRTPTTGERKRLTWVSLDASICVSIVLVIVLLASTDQLYLLATIPGLVTQLGTGMVIGITVLV